MDTANKIHPLQYSLDFFDTPEVPDYDQILTDKALALVEALNDGLKPKERYIPHYTFQEGKYIVLIVVNREKDVMCNILDNEGNQPPNLSVCWRNGSHIRQDLKELQNLKN